MEAKYPGKFRFELSRDNGVSGRLEVTIFLDSKAASDKGALVVHTKAGGQGYPYQDWAAFEKRLEEAVTGKI